MSLSTQNHIDVSSTVYGAQMWISGSIVCLQIHANKTTKLIMVYEHDNAGTIRNGLWHSGISDP